MNKIIGLVLTGVLVLGGCAKKEEEKTDGESTTPTEITMADLAGDGAHCVDIPDNRYGSLFSGKAYTRNFELTADGEWGMSIFFATGACSGNGINANGNNFAAISMGGTYTLDGASADVPTASALTFTITRHSVNVQLQYSDGVTLRDELRNQCTLLQFVSPLQTIPAGGAQCSRGSTVVVLDDFLPFTQTYQQIVQKSSGRLLSAEVPYFWAPGEYYGYPTALSDDHTFLGW